jgi:hypothetical protein
MVTTLGEVLRQRMKLVGQQIPPPPFSRAAIRGRVLSDRKRELQLPRGFRSRVFDRVAHDNIAKMSDFLPELCREERMSPWSAERTAQKFARRLSATYSFQYAVGGKPTGVDQVISGSLASATELAVPFDRIEIGGRPILTLGRVRG